MDHPDEMLSELLHLKYAFDAASSERKLELLRTLARRSLSDEKQVYRLHEILCFWRAYPGSPELLERIEQMLADFHRRGDLRRFRRRLTDTGVAGTDIHFRFYWLTAFWLRRQGIDRLLSIDWPVFDQKDRLVEMLPLLQPYTETPALDEFPFTPKQWLETLKASEETDASYVIRRFEAMKDAADREYLYEKLDIPLRLESRERTPARGREKWDRSPVLFQTRPLNTKRPSLRKVIRETEPAIRAVDERTGQKLIDLANGAMVARHRDLLVFLHADPRDVRIVDFGDGLQFACMGTRPEKRLMLESVYGFLTLKNGVPIGYVLCSALFGSSEVAYNVFETYRGGEAAQIYGRLLAMVQRIFDSDCFAVDPYQLGHDNQEGLESGAWWFYYKLGFRPVDPYVRELVKQELAKLKRKPKHRSTLATLQELSSEYVFLNLARSRPGVLGKVSLGNIGLAAMRYLAERFGSDRERGLRTCSRELWDRLGLRPSKLSAGERVAWTRWAPLLMAIPNLEKWTLRQRRGVRDVVRAKGGRRESDFVVQLNRHTRLQKALLELAEGE